jgi:signal peptidase I
VVLSESMEPAIHRSDLLVLTNYMEPQPLTVGDIVVYKLPGRRVSIVHRIVRVHENVTRAVDVLKGDNNLHDDRELYGRGMQWLERHMIVGRSCAFLPYAGKLTILMNDYPKLKVVLLVVLSALAFIGGD